MPNFASTYARFRGSPLFLEILMGFVALWMALHFLFGFDPDFGDLNLVLSTEASISLAFFTMTGDLQAREQSMQTNAVIEMVAEVRVISKSLIEIAESQRLVLEGHSSTLRELRSVYEKMLSKMDVK